MEIIMATEAEKNDALVHRMSLATGNPKYFLERNHCMSGEQAVRIRESREKGTIQPDVGDLCLALVKHSADVQANPKVLQANPDQGLLTPYLAILADKPAIPVTAENIHRVLNAYVVQAKDPETRAMNAASFPFVVSTSVGGPKTASADLIMTPGSSLDAAFTRATLDFIAGKPTQLRTPSKPEELEKLREDTNLCFRNNKAATIGMCNDAGEQQAANYIAAKKASAVRR
jgi:hypothetical protein